MIETTDDHRVSKFCQIFASSDSFYTLAAKLIQIMTIRIEITNKINREGKYPLILRICHNKIRKAVTTNIALRSSKELNTKARSENWIRSSVPEAAVYNRQLKELRLKYIDAFHRLPNPGTATPEDIVKMFNNPEGTASEGQQSITKFFREEIECIKEAGQYNNWKNTNNFYNKFEEFLHMKKLTDISFAELNLQIVNDFISYLQKLPNGRDKTKKLAPNTITTTLKRFHALLIRAKEREIYNPSETILKALNRTWSPTTKAKLTDEEIRTLLDLEIPEFTPMWHARNIFLLGFYCAGMRIGDLLMLKWKYITTEGRLEYDMQKNGKQKNLLLIPQAKEIIKKYYKDNQNLESYIFPFLEYNPLFSYADSDSERDSLSWENRCLMHRNLESATEKVNKQLHKIEETIGLTKSLSTHVNRHSFARKAKNKGVDNAMLKDLLSHSHLNITEQYIGNFETHSIDKALMDTFDVSTGKNGDNFNDEKTTLLNQLANLSAEKLKEVINSLSL